jgi:hypothetical protein
MTHPVLVVELWLRALVAKERGKLLGGVMCVAAAGAGSCV